MARVWRVVIGVGSKRFRLADGRRNSRWRGHLGQPLCYNLPLRRVMIVISFDSFSLSLSRSLSVSFVVPSFLLVRVQAGADGRPWLLHSARRRKSSNLWRFFGRFGLKPANNRLADGRPRCSTFLAAAAAAANPEAPNLSSRTPFLLPPPRTCLHETKKTSIFHAALFDSSAFPEVFQCFFLLRVDPPHFMIVPHHFR